MIRTFVMSTVAVLALAACQEAPATPAPAETAEATSEASAPGASEMAPAFTLADSDGVQRSLSDFRGKVVVLEWTNEGCPYVKKHYTGAMQELQRQAVADDVVWLTIISSSPGTQGYVEGDAAREWRARNDAHATHLLLDPTGVTGQAYGAVTTPDMRVIDAEGRILFAGGIDDRPTSRVEDLEGATNYVRLALDDHAAGRPVATTFAQPYGCAIKYPGVE